MKTNDEKIAELEATKKDLLDMLQSVSEYFDAIDEMNPSANRGTAGLRLRQQIAEIIGTA